MPEAWRRLQSVVAVEVADYLGNACFGGGAVVQNIARLAVGWEEEAPAALMG